MSKKPPTLVQFTYSEPSKTLEEQMKEQQQPLALALAEQQQQQEDLEDPIDTLVASFASFGSNADDLDSPVLRTGNKRNAEVSEEEEEPIKVVGKPDIDEKSIFSNYPEPSAKSEMSNAKPKKPRKPMSEEHKAKLALAREKAMASRKAKAEERKKMKALENEEKELVKKQRVKRVQKLKEEVEGSDSLDLRSSNKRDAEEPKETIESPPKSPSTLAKQQHNLTRKDLEEAQLDAIMKYEAMRKERKAKKKQEQAIEAEKQKMLNTIQRATGTYGYRKTDPTGRLMNRFDSCY
jgi:hypothetical protein